MPYREPEVAVKRSRWHESGEPLVQAFKGLAEQRSLAELPALVDRLGEAAAWRHDIVHGEWIPTPGVGIVTFRRERPKAAPDGGYAGRSWTVDCLQELAHEYKLVERGPADLVLDFMGCQGQITEAWGRLVVPAFQRGALLPRAAVVRPGFPCGDRRLPRDAFAVPLAVPPTGRLMVRLRYM